MNPPPGTKYFDDKAAFLEPKVTQYGSNMVMTQVMKPSKTRYVNVDTRFAQSNNPYTCEYMMTLPERLTNIKSIKVRQVEIPLSFYNISACLGNNQCQVVEVDSNTRHTITVPDNNYSMVELAVMLNTLVSTALGCIVTFTLGSKNTTIEANCGRKLQFVWWTESVSGSIKMQLGWVLGFRKASVEMTSKTTAEAVANIHTIRYLFLVLDEFSTHVPQSFLAPMSHNILQQKILCRIQIQDQNPFGFTQSCDDATAMYSDKRVYPGVIDIQRLKLQVVNEWGQPLSLNGCDFSFLLEMECT